MAAIVGLVAFAVDVVAGSAGAVALGVAALGHEVFQDAMEVEIVVLSAFDERDEVTDSLRRFVLEQLEDDCALGGGELHARKVVGLGLGFANGFFLGPQFFVFLYVGLDIALGVVGEDAEIFGLLDV